MAFEITDGQHPGFRRGWKLLPHVPETLVGAQDDGASEVLPGIVQFTGCTIVQRWGQA
jgi:hypothetical protein